MNIPAELIFIANQCDVYGMKEEADTLTEIAQMLMSAGYGNTSNDAPAQQEISNANPLDTIMGNPMDSINKLF